MTRISLATVRQAPGTGGNRQQTKGGHSAGNNMEHRFNQHPSDSFLDLSVTKTTYRELIGRANGHRAARTVCTRSLVHAVLRRSNCKWVKAVFYTPVIGHRPCAAERGKQLRWWVMCDSKPWIENNTSRRGWSWRVEGEPLPRKGHLVLNPEARFKGGKKNITCFFRELIIAATMDVMVVAHWTPLRSPQQTLSVRSCLPYQQMVIHATNGRKLFNPHLLLLPGNLFTVGMARNWGCTRRGRCNVRVTTAALSTIKFPIF